MTTTNEATSTTCTTTPQRMKTPARMKAQGATDRGAPGLRPTGRRRLRTKLRALLIGSALATVASVALADDVWNGTNTTGQGWRQGPVAIGSSFCGKDLCIETGSTLGTGDGIWMTRGGSQALGILSNMANGAWGPMTQAGDFMFLLKGPSGGNPQAGLVIAPWGSQPGGLRIAENGNVGIGTPNPGAFRLAVNGSVRAKEVIVDTGWADFVFDDDYPLMPLDEVARHIAEKGHLPDIPSAQEVEANGVSIGEMQAKLLQKVEELTLYMIDLEQDNDTLRAMLETAMPETAVFETGMPKNTDAWR